MKTQVCNAALQLRCSGVGGIPNDGRLVGLSLFAQWLVVDPNAQGLLLIGGGALSKGAEIRIGNP